jgi:hypothetical protein
MATCEMQIGQCGHHINLAAVLGQTAQLGLLKAELLLDHSKWVFDFGANVGLGGHDQILQSSLLSL